MFTCRLATSTFCFPLVSEAGQAAGAGAYLTRTDQPVTYRTALHPT